MNKYWPSIKSSVTNPIFITFLIALIGTLVSGEPVAVITAVIGFVGLKTLANVGTKTNDSEKELSTLEHFICSSRTWVAVFGCIYAYVLNIPEQISPVLAALGSGMTVDWIGLAAKQIDWSKLKRTQEIVVNPTPAPTPELEEPEPEPEEPELEPEEVPEIEPITKTFKERMDALKANLNYDNMWELLASTVKVRIDAMMKRMLRLNPSLSTIDAVKAIADEYLNRALTRKDCSDIIDFLGLYPVLAANHDLDILRAFEDSYKGGRLMEYQLETFKNMAIVWQAIAMVSEAACRATEEQVEGESPMDAVNRKITALQEFGISHSDALKSQWSGDTLRVWNKNHYELFNPYALAGIEELRKWASRV